MIRASKQAPSSPSPFFVRLGGGGDENIFTSVRVEDGSVSDSVYCYLPSTWSPSSPELSRRTFGIGFGWFRQRSCPVSRNRLRIKTRNKLDQHDAKCWSYVCVILSHVSPSATHVMFHVPLFKPRSSLPGGETKSLLHNVSQIVGNPHLVSLEACSVSDA